MSDYFIGIDGGGTKTEIVIVDNSGRIVARGTGGPGNFSTMSEKSFIVNVRQAIPAVPNCKAAAAVAAGVLSDADKLRLQRLLAPILKCNVVFAAPDFVGALAACPRNSVLCVLAGTGSAVISGKVDDWRKSGGGGYLLGDEGSGYAMGKALMQAAWKNPNSLSASLKIHVLSEFGVRTLEDAVASIYRAESPAAALAKLAEPIARAYIAGDKTAKKIVEVESGKLAQIALRHLREDKVSEGTLSLIGGLWKAGKCYEREFVIAITNRQRSTENFEVRKCNRDIGEAVANLAKARYNGVAKKKYEH